MKNQTAAGFSRVRRFTASLSWFERIVAAFAVAVLVYGVAQIGGGLYIKIKAQAAQVLLERAWDRAIAGEIAPRPWPWADTWPVAKIAVPRIDKQAIILAGAHGEAMAFGPGHMQGTPLPGANGTGIVAGHRDTHFAFLKDVVAGDTFTMTLANGNAYSYEVTGTEVVHHQASGIEPHAPGLGIALVTCFPFEAREQGPLRYVVHAVQKQTRVSMSTDQ